MGKIEVKFENSQWIPIEVVVIKVDSKKEREDDCEEEDNKI
jgi:hypothetical protein